MVYLWNEESLEVSSTFCLPGAPPTGPPGVLTPGPPPPGPAGEPNECCKVVPHQKKGNSWVNRQISYLLEISGIFPFGRFPDPSHTEVLGFWWNWNVGIGANQRMYREFTDRLQYTMTLALGRAFCHHYVQKRDFFNKKLVNLSCTPTILKRLLPGSVMRREASISAVEQSRKCIFETP